MAIDKNGENTDNSASHKSNDVNAMLAAPENFQWSVPPPCKSAEEHLKNFDKNMKIAQHLLEANSKTPVVIDEEIKKILIERFEKQHVLLAGMTYAEASEYLDS